MSDRRITLIPDRNDSFKLTVGGSAMFITLLNIGQNPNADFPFKITGVGCSTLELTQTEAVHIISAWLLRTCQAPIDYRCTDSQYEFLFRMK